jgi:hypothetical protein
MMTEEDRIHRGRKSRRELAEEFLKTHPIGSVVLTEDIPRVIQYGALMLYNVCYKCHHIWPDHSMDDPFRCQRKRCKCDGWRFGWRIDGLVPVKP